MQGIGKGVLHSGDLVVCHSVLGREVQGAGASVFSLEGIRGHQQQYIKWL